MVNAHLRRFSLVLCGLLLATLALAVCGDDPPPTPHPANEHTAPQSQEAQPSATAAMQSEGASASSAGSADQNDDQSSEHDAEPGSPL